jgi:hypothetical protein
VTHQRKVSKDTGADNVRAAVGEGLERQVVRFATLLHEGGVCDASRAADEANVHERRVKDNLSHSPNVDRDDFFRPRRHWEPLVCKILAKEEPAAARDRRGRRQDRVRVESYSGFAPDGMAALGCHAEEERVFLDDVALSRDGCGYR